MRRRLQKRTSIALLLDYLGGDYQLGLLQAVEESAAEHDLNLLVAVGRALEAPNPVDAAQNEIYARVGSDSVDGVIAGSGCIGIHVNTDALTQFLGRFGSLAKCSISAELHGIPSLGVSNRRGMRAMVDHVIVTHGCRRIAYIRGPMGGDEAQARFEGYVDALASHGIALDPHLVEAGDFWIQSGAEATRRLLDRGEKFDALVVANDYMALGAIEVLHDRGVRIPQEVVVTGFDDVPSARIAYPSLSTVRQPLSRLGRLAVETILRQLDGQAVPDRVELDVDLVARQSCGCAYRARETASASPPPGPLRAARDEVDANAVALCDAMTHCVPIAPAALDGWADRMLEGLRRELAGSRGEFLIELEHVLDAAQPRADVIYQFNAVIGALRSHFRDIPLDPRHARTLDDLWHSAVLVVGAASNRSQMRTAFDSEHAQDVLRGSVERLATALTHPALTDSLREVLPAVSIRSAAISLYEDAARQQLRAFFAWADGKDQGFATNVFPSSRVAPDEFLQTERRWSYFLMPLTFGSEHLGLALFDMATHVSVPRMLREQIGAALKGAALHQAVVQQTALRQRAERDQLHKEMQIAQRIQTAILPIDISADGLELAALMLPAAEVGGDYYDVLPTERGCLIGIGDVTGHGLLAGLVMLMIQGIVAGMVAVDAEAAPSKLIAALNRALFENVRHRLNREEHATLLLVRYDRDGSLVFAGHHEEIILCRARTARCERIRTEGFWLAAAPDIGGLTTDSRARLESGDLIVLYTDGVVEAMSAHGEVFGVERLCAVIESHRMRPVKEICAAVAHAAREWSPPQADDISVLVGRYTPPLTPDSLRA
ncbi:MAG TPA: SpoIIE family protein phosphatase [Polyangiaceae bacterium]|nr:SpoIIE family protein phosphatase [Polyangiaceae bacterium]